MAGDVAEFDHARLLRVAVVASARLLSLIIFKIHDLFF
jgi:hypothetical protein